MSTPWVEREAVITVKAYPNPSAKYGETVCVAAITREEGWIRLYPVRFRSLRPDRRFRKYQRVRLRMRKHARDPRPESYHPDEDSFELLDVIGSRQGWKHRRDWILPTLSPSMCEIQARQRENGMSLGAFRPKEVIDLVIEEVQDQWSAKQQAAMSQLLLFDERPDELEKIPLGFKYRYTCADPECRGHLQSVYDWELMELYRNVRATSRDIEELKLKIRQKYLDEICGPTKDTCFFVGNHSRFPVTFMVLGVFWPPKGAQKSLFGE